MESEIDESEYESDERVSSSMSVASESDEESLVKKKAKK